LQSIYQNATEQAEGKSIKELHRLKRTDKTPQAAVHNYAISNAIKQKKLEIAKEAK